MDNESRSAGRTSLLARGLLLTFLGAVTASPVSDAATIAERYEASNDLAGFIVQRAALPAEGSYFYAYLARRECRGGVAVARLLTEALHQVPDELKAGMARQRERCANIPQLDDAAAAYALERADREAGAASGDKYFSALAWTASGLMRLSSDEDVRRALRLFAVIDDRNMRAIELQEFFAVNMTVNGRRLDADQAHAFHLAMELTGCTLGVEKGGPSRTMGGIVTLLGECDDPDRTAVRKRMSGVSVPFKPDWPLVDRYQAQLIAAMRSGDWSAFGAAPAVPSAAPRRVAPPASTDPR